MPAQPDFIDALVEDLSPVRPAPGRLRTLILWGALSWAFVSAAILLSGPLREGVLDELFRSPRLALELGIGIAAGLTALAAGLELGGPGSPSPLRLWLPPLVLIGCWVLLLSYAIGNPVVEPSLTGRREHCLVETLCSALPPLALGLHLLRKRVVFSRATAGLLVGAGAAALPAVWMQLACRVDPLHGMLLHLSPMLLLAAAGAVLAHRFLPRA